MIKSCIRKIGIDKSIAYSSGARIIQSFSGLLLVFFIGKYLTQSEQGYYYTFSSLLALQVFFELGLNNIIMQYVAYERSSLSLKNGEFVGDIVSLSRLASILVLVKKYYLILCISFFIIVGLGGYLYYTYFNIDNSVNWQLPWLLVLAGTAFNLYLAPFTSFMMGLGFVEQMSKISFIQQLLIPSVSVICFVLGFNLYVIGISSCLSSIYIYFILNNSFFSQIFKSLSNVCIQETVNFRIEILPYQWKIALSWINGYFIFQLFNPIIFATEGAVMAGKVGMTIQILNGIQAFSFSWLKTKIPLYSSLIARKEYLKLDRIFNITIRQMLFVCAFLIILFLIFILVLNHCVFIKGTIFDLSNRLLNIETSLFLIFPLLANQFINSWATYLRCHKKEPFLISSCVGGILCFIFIPIQGKYYGVYGVLGAYCIITLFVLLPWSYRIFKNKKLLWHQKTNI